MKRRVIFVPDDYWTDPPNKETDMTIDPANAGDYRRAGVFIKHHAYTNSDGMNAILIEAIEAERTSHLIQAILATYDAIVPQLITHHGQRCMAEMLITYAHGDPSLAPELNRAARFLLAYGDNQTDAMNSILREEDNVSPTVVALLDVYAAILPTLHTPFGMDIIERGIRTLSGMEAKGEG